LQFILQRREAHTLRIRRAEPIWTAAGKLMPLRFERPDSSGWL
jgi:hypothetical protein